MIDSLWIGLSIPFGFGLFMLISSLDDSRRDRKDQKEEKEKPQEEFDPTKRVIR